MSSSPATAFARRWHILMKGSIVASARATVARLDARRRSESCFSRSASITFRELAGETIAEPYACSIVDGVVRGADPIEAAHADLVSGRPRTEIAAAFHDGVAALAVAVCANAAEPGTVVLSGGSFQNLRQLASTRSGLEQAGFRVLTHRTVPPNDGGISYGQAAVAAARS